MTNGLLRHVTVEESTSIQWVMPLQPTKERKGRSTQTKEDKIKHLVSQYYITCTDHYSLFPKLNWRSIRGGCIVRHINQQFYTRLLLV